VGEKVEQPIPVNLRRNSAAAAAFCCCLLVVIPVLRAILAYHVP
jgi:hypothetical protein